MILLHRDRINWQDGARTGRRWSTRLFRYSTELLHTLVKRNILLLYPQWPITSFSTTSMIGYQEQTNRDQIKS